MMEIIKKFAQKNKDLYSTRQPVIAFLGDSVTQGCFECFVENGAINTVFETKNSYAENFKRILLTLFPCSNPTVINAGISGDQAPSGLKRLYNDVLTFKPDLLVVCYGLNDAMQGEKGIEEYEESLRGIFKEAQNGGCEIIFMTPNLRSNRSDSTIREEWLKTVADGVVQNEIDGWLEKYLLVAKNVCNEMGIRVCDCNSVWKSFKSCGVDINLILANRINHPLRELHWLFAYELVKTMLTED